MDGVETAGGLITGGLIAKLLSRRESRQETSAEQLPGACSDCGAPVSGRFCSECGQPTHVHRTLLHLGEEVLHGVMHFDARIWRTLPLLILNPGRLTREWVQGRRTRYVSPLALFLFTIFLMFFVFSFSIATEPDTNTTLSQAERAGLTQDLATARTELAAATRASEVRPGSEALKLTQRARESAVGVFETRLGVADRTAKRADGFTTGSWQAQVHDAAASGEVKVKLGNEHLNEKITKKLLNPDLAIYKIQQTAYKFSFLLSPISIPFVALLFLWRRGFTLYDHGVFVLYSLTAMSMLMTLISIFGPLWSGFAVMASLLILFGVPIHMFAQLRGAYKLSWFSAAWRTFFLLMFCSIAFILFILAIMTLGLTG